jgi:hypothetical protein
MSEIQKQRCRFIGSYESDLLHLVDKRGHGKHLAGSAEREEKLLSWSSSKKDELESKAKIVIVMELYVTFTALRTRRETNRLQERGF